ncbi:hypothetical protein ACFL42_01115 [Candidatus Omnitrophota bacterium]
MKKRIFRVWAFFVLPIFILNSVCYAQDLTPRDSLGVSIYKVTEENMSPYVISQALSKKAAGKAVVDENANIALRADEIAERSVYQEMLEFFRQGREVADEMPGLEVNDSILWAAYRITVFSAMRKAERDEELGLWSALDAKLKLAKNVYEVMIVNNEAATAPVAAEENWYQELTSDMMPDGPLSRRRRSPSGALETAYEGWTANLDDLHDIFKTNRGAREIGVIAGRGMAGLAAEKIRRMVEHAIRADGQTIVQAHTEWPRAGQFKGALMADAAWEPKRVQGRRVRVAPFIFGRGKRLSPITQRFYSAKMLIPMLIRLDKNSPWLSSAEASTLTWNLVAANLERMGFSGMACKWSDEPQLPAFPLSTLNYDLSNTHLLRLFALRPTTDYFSENKEWGIIDPKTGKLVRWFSRRERDRLMADMEPYREQYGLQFDTDGNLMAPTHLGSPAFSDLFLSTARRIFGELMENPDFLADIDGYLQEMLMLDDQEFEAERARISKIDAALKDYPNFRKKAQEFVKEMCRLTGASHFSELVSAIDFGEHLVWLDTGTIAKYRGSLYVVNEEGPQADFARQLACIDHIERNRDGNIIVGDCYYPAGAITNSVLIDTQVMRVTAGQPIDGAVLVNSNIGNIRALGPGSVSFGSTVIELTAGERAFLFFSVRDALTLRDDHVHTSIPDDQTTVETILTKGLLDWTFDATQDPQEVYDKVAEGNPAGRTFQEQYDLSSEGRGVTPDAMEGAIDQLRQPLVQRMPKRRSPSGALEDGLVVIQNQKALLERRNQVSGSAEVAELNLRTWLTDAQYEGLKPEVEALISRAWNTARGRIRNKKAAAELYKNFASDTPYYFTIDFEALPEGVGPNARNDITRAKMEADKAEIERLLAEWEDKHRRGELDAEVAQRITEVRAILLGNADDLMTIDGYASNYGLSHVRAAAELRFLSSVNRELQDEDGKTDIYSGIEMIDNPAGENLGPVFRKFDIKAHGQVIAFRTYDLRAAIKSNFWFMPGLVEPKFFGAMMSEKLAFKSGQGAATYAIKDAESVYGKGQVPVDNMWSIVSSGCRLYSESLKEAYALGLQAAGMKVLMVGSDQEGLKRVDAWLDEDVRTHAATGGQRGRTRKEADSFLDFARRHIERRGIISTPQYYFLTRLLRYRWISLGVRRDETGLDDALRDFYWASHGTGSHNPAEYNGFKQVIVRWIRAMLGLKRDQETIINQVLSINDGQMRQIRDMILAEKFRQVRRDQMQQTTEKMPAVEVAYIHNEYVKARARLGEAAWGYLLGKAVADPKNVPDDMKAKRDVKETEEHLRHQGLDRLILDVLRNIDWDAEWRDITIAIEAGMGWEQGEYFEAFPNRPALCRQRPFEVLTQIAGHTGRESAFGMDYMHGSAGLATWAYRDLGFGDSFRTYREEPDGTFKGGEPYPNLFEFTRPFVRLLRKWRIPGFARDEDADRCILYTKDGKMIQGDQMMAALAEYRIKQEVNKNPDDRKKLIFIGEVKFSTVLETHINNVLARVNKELPDGQAPIEAQVCLTPVGFGYIKDAMKDVSTAILEGEDELTLFANRPSVLGDADHIRLTGLQHAEPVILGAELSGHQMDKFWFAEDELTVINMLSAWTEAIYDQTGGDPQKIKENAEQLFGILDDLVNNVPVVSASPEERLGTPEQFTEEEVEAIVERAGTYAAEVATKTHNMADDDPHFGLAGVKGEMLKPESIAKDAATCKEIIVQGTLKNFVDYMESVTTGWRMLDETVTIAGDECFVFETDKPITIEQGGSFMTLHNVSIKINTIDGMLVYFDSDEGRGSFVIRKSNTQPEVISRTEGKTLPHQHAVGVFALSFFERYQGTAISRDIYVSEEMMPQLAYKKMSDDGRAALDALVPEQVRRVRQAIANGTLSGNLMRGNLGKFVFFKDADEKKEEHERLVELAVELEMGTSQLTDLDPVDLRRIVDAYLGNVLTAAEKGMVQGEYRQRIRQEVKEYGSAELYRGIQSLAAKYVNIRVRDVLVGAIELTSEAGSATGSGPSSVKRKSPSGARDVEFAGIPGKKRKRSRHGERVRLSIAEQRARTTKLKDTQHIKRRRSPSGEVALAEPPMSPGDIQTSLVVASRSTASITEAGGELEIPEDILLDLSEDARSAVELIALFKGLAENAAAAETPATVIVGIELDWIHNYAFGRIPEQGLNRFMSGLGKLGEYYADKYGIKNMRIVRGDSNDLLGKITDAAEEAESDYSYTYVLADVDNIGAYDAITSEGARVTGVDNSLLVEAYDNRKVGEDLFLRVVDMINIAIIDPDSPVPPHIAKNFDIFIDANGNRIITPHAAQVEMDRLPDRYDRLLEALIAA